MPNALENWFFMSYAWADNVEQDVGDSAVSAFFKLVESSLAGKVETTFANGFLDRRRLDPGLNWEDTLTAALRGARAFLPLLTLRYFSREACAKEWAAFQARAGAHPRGSELLIPIIWDRPVRIKAPDGLQLALAESNVLPNDVDHIKAYNKVGLKVFVDRMATDSGAAATVRVVADAITELIVSRYGEILMPVAGNGLVPHWNDLPTTFSASQQPAGGPGQAVLHFAVAAATRDEIGNRRPNALRFYPGTRSDWVPYDAAGKTISQVVLETSRCLNLPYSWLPVSAGLVNDIRGLEAQGCAPVVVLVDPWSLEVASLTGPLSAYDQQRFKNCVVIVVWNEEGVTDAVEARRKLQAAVQKVFSRSLPQLGESAFFNTQVKDVDGLQAALLRAIQDVRALAAPQQPALRPVQSSDAPPVARNQ